MNRYLIAMVAMVAAFCAEAERQPYERYQSVVDRQMFGPLPPDFDPTKSPAEVQKSSSKAEKELTKEQEKVKSAIRFSVINVTPEGETAIGFTDNSDPKAPVHYYLKVGEQSNGWEVKEADAEAATMTISKDGIEVSLSLGGDSAQNGDATKRAVTGGARITTTQSGNARNSGALFGGGSLSERRMMRRRQREEESAKVAEAAAKKAEERAAKEAEEKAAREAEREAEKAEREAEREEQRKQLQAIKDELQKARDAKAAIEKAAEKKESENQEGSDGE